VKSYLELEMALYAIADWLSPDATVVSRLNESLEST
jgi:hypothetical protein